VIRSPHIATGMWGCRTTPKRKEKVHRCLNTPVVATSPMMSFVVPLLNITDSDGWSFSPPSPRCSPWTMAPTPSASRGSCPAFHISPACTENPPPTLFIWEDPFAPTLWGLSQTLGFFYGGVEEEEDSATIATRSL
jgi:hypothetical protein